MNKPEILSAIKAQVKFFNTQVSQSSSHPTCPKSKSPEMSKVQVTWDVQSPSFPNCQGPSYSKSKSHKSQVPKSSSYPKSKLPRLPKVQVAQVAKSPSCPHIEKTYCSPMAKNIHGAAIANKAKNFYCPTMTKIFMAHPWSEILLGPITLIYWKLSIFFPYNLLFLIIFILNGNHCKLEHWKKGSQPSNGQKY